ncbi:hypothetical protein C0Q95_18575 [Streptomyces albidoflavus]|nr:hypothetical protein C0Q95_18575 [Streptomyces albidoflavus]
MGRAPQGRRDQLQLRVVRKDAATMTLLDSAMSGAVLTHLPEQRTDLVLRAQMEESPLTEAIRARVTETTPPSQGWGRSCRRRRARRGAKMGSFRG